MTTISTPFSITISVSAKTYTLLSTQLGVLSDVLALVGENAAEAEIRALINRSVGIIPQAAIADRESVSNDAGKDDEQSHQSIHGGYAGQDEDGDFYVLADGGQLSSFESFETALDYAKVMHPHYDFITIEDPSKNILASLDCGGVEIHELKLEKDPYFASIDEAVGNRHSIVSTSEKFNTDKTLTEESSRLYEVHGDGVCIDAFATQKEASEGALRHLEKFRMLNVILASNSNVLETIEGWLDTFLVVANSEEQGRFYSLDDAKSFAIRCFRLDPHIRVVVLDSNKHEVVVLKS